MERILIIGSSGTGKSVCARKLGKILDLPVFHLDCFFWQPNWVRTPQEEFLNSLQAVLQKPRWIIDGNYSKTMQMRFKYADTVIFLDYPTSIALFRVLKRQIIHRNRPRPDITPGCREKIDKEFLLWVWGFRKSRRPQILEMLADPAHSHLTTFQFSHPKKLEKWLNSLQV